MHAVAVSNGPPKMVILHMNMALHAYEDIMRMTEDLSEKYIIGYGASSTVYKCVLKNCKPVAIKKLYAHYPQSLKEFETELETVGSIKHRNLVSLQGYSLSPVGNLLFYDYMESGSLWDVLHGKSSSQHMHPSFFFGGGVSRNQESSLINQLVASATARLSISIVFVCSSIT
jgi:serine/threonine protein kinase